MRAFIENIVIDCHDDKLLAAFWTATLGYEIDADQPEDWVLLCDPEGKGPNIGLQVVPESKLVKNRVHIDLAVGEGGLEAEVARLAGFDATRVRYVENDPDESHWVMADPEGNEFCMLRPAWEPRPS